MASRAAERLVGFRIDSRVEPGSARLDLKQTGMLVGEQSHRLTQALGAVCPIGPLCPQHQGEGAGHSFLPSRDSAGRTAHGIEAEYYRLEAGSAQLAMPQRLDVP